MNELKIRGKMKVIFATEEKKNKFNIREFVVDVSAQYPNIIPFQLINDKCSIVDNLTENDEVEVHFMPVGNEYNGKYYVKLTAWKVEKV